MATPDELLTVPQAAARLGLTRAALDRFIADGRLPLAARAGRLRLLRAADVDAWNALPRRGGGRPRKPQDSEQERRADRDRPQDTEDAPAGD